jgi:hypothetical protein
MLVTWRVRNLERRDRDVCAGLISRRFRELSCLSLRQLGVHSSEVEIGNEKFLQNINKLGTTLAFMQEEQKYELHYWYHIPLPESSLGNNITSHMHMHMHVRHALSNLLRSLSSCI